MFENFNIFEKFLLFLSVIVGLILSIALEYSFLGYIATATGIICVLLAAKGHISTFGFGIVNSITYSILALNSGLNGEVLLNLLFFIPMRIRGYYQWRKHLSSGVVEKRDLTRGQYILIFTITTIVLIIYSNSLVWIGENIPFFNTQQVVLLDAFSTIFSISAMYLMIHRYAAQWLLWILVNFVSVAMWFVLMVRGNTEAVGMVFMWGLYLINSIYGYFKWLNESKIKDISQISMS